MEPLGFGTATSSYQIEGGTLEDGRGPSIWDTFCAEPGRILDDSNGSVACGSYHRWAEDLDLLAELGVTAYRFSLAWPRIQPSGKGPAEPRGLDYYERLVDGLIERGIRPFPTLYHWDLPQELEDAGGWPVRATAERFVEYTTHVVNRIGDRVTSWATFNEPWCAAFLGYSAGVHAPGRTDPEAAFAAAHHQLIAHTWSRDALKAASPKAEVGIVLNLSPVWSEPGVDPMAVRMVDAVQNRIWLDPLAEGSYPELLIERSPALTEAGVVLQGDLAAVHGSLDWMGINYYSGYRLGPGYEGALPSRAAAHPYTPSCSWQPREPLTEMGWEIVPEGMTEILLSTAERFPGLTLRVTENGAAFADTQRDEDGAVIDDDRVDYLRTHIDAVEAARTQGARVLDYFAWSLLDNFEWAEGYRKTFGLVGVEADTLRRVPKKSFRWYAERIRQS
jgi:beta-glucosidase